MFLELVHHAELPGYFILNAPRVAVVLVGVLGYEAPVFLRDRAVPHLKEAVFLDVPDRLLAPAAELRMAERLDEHLLPGKVAEGFLRPRHVFDLLGARHFPFRLTR